MTRKRLGEILVAAGVLDDTALRGALAEQKRTGGALGKILVERGVLEESDLVLALSRQLNIPEANLEEGVDPNAVELVSLEEARKYNALAFRIEGRFLELALADPTNASRFIDELQTRTHLAVRVHLAGASAIERAIEQHYG